MANREGHSGKNPREASSFLNERFCVSVGHAAKIDLAVSMTLADVLLLRCALSETDQIGNVL